MSTPPIRRCRLPSVILILGWTACLLADPAPAQEPGGGASRPASIFADAEEVRVIDVDVVVTEHGIADLRGRTDAERDRLLRTVAG
mgnify:CR=1 FL=1